VGQPRRTKNFWREKLPPTEQRAFWRENTFLPRTKGFSAGRLSSRHFPGNGLPGWSNPVQIRFGPLFGQAVVRILPDSWPFSVVGLTEESGLLSTLFGWGPRRGCPSRLVQPGLETFYIQANIFPLRPKAGLADKHILPPRFAEGSYL